MAKKITDEEYIKIIQTEVEVILKGLAARQISHEQCLHVLAAATGNILGNIAIRKETFEMRMAETRFREMFDHYADLAQEATIGNSHKAYGEEGELDPKDIK